MRRKHWDSKTKVLPEETFRIWGVNLFNIKNNLFQVLDQALYNYYRLL